MKTNNEQTTKIIYKEFRVLGIFTYYKCELKDKKLSKYLFGRCTLRNSFIYTFKFQEIVRKNDIVIIFLKEL